MRYVAKTCLLLMLICLLLKQTEHDWILTVMTVAC